MHNINILDYLIVIFGTINMLRMGLFLIGSDVYHLKSHLRKRKNHRSKYQPRVSIIIPAHNEEKTIMRTLDSVRQSTYPQNKLEIILVDDGSTDNTHCLARVYKFMHKTQNLKIIHQDNAGKAHALNRGIRDTATGRLIMCLDSDSLLAPNAIANAVEYFRDRNIKALSANVKIIKGNTLLNFIQRFEYIVCYQMKKAQTIYNIEYIIGGIGSTFRRSMLERVNFYDTNTVTEDIDLTMKIIGKGNKHNKVIYADNVIAYTESCLTLSALIRQRYRWKWGRAQTFYKNLSLFFNKDQRYTKLLTFWYLPFAIYGDFAFLFEPILVGYIFFITFYYRDIMTILSACIVLSVYFSMNALAEETLSLRDRIQFIITSPLMYFLFFVLSFVEYIALIKTILNIRGLSASLEDDICNWQHVERFGDRNISSTLTY